MGSVSADWRSDHVSQSRATDTGEFATHRDRLEETLCTCAYSRCPSRGCSDSTKHTAKAQAQKNRKQINVRNDVRNVASSLPRPAGPHLFMSSSQEGWRVGNGDF